MKKAMLTFLMSSLFLIPNLHSASVTIDSTWVLPGQVVNVPVTSKNIPAFASISMVIHIDPGFVHYIDLVDINPTLLTYGLLIYDYYAPDSNIKLAYFTLAPVTLIGDTLFSIKLRHHLGNSPLIFGGVPGENAFSNIGGGTIPVTFYDGALMEIDTNIITQQPTSVTVSTTTTANFNVNSPYATNFKWQASSAKGNFIDIHDNYIYSGTDTDSLIINVGQLPSSTYQYRCKVSDSVSGYSDTTQPATLTVIDTSQNPGQSCSARLKVFLQGAFTGGNMTTHLNTAGYIPNAQPYNPPPWNHPGTETLASIPPQMTDWLLLELRSTSDTIVARTAAVLQSNGTVTDINGKEDISFDAPAGEYYIAIKHRNHMSVMTRNKLQLPDTITYDFSDTLNFPVYGHGVFQFGMGPCAMIAGDLNQNSVLKYSGAANDRSLILQKIIGATGGTSLTGTITGYFIEDPNMNGICKYSGAGNDPIIILQNLVMLTGSNALTSTFNCMVPIGYLKAPKD